VYIRSVPPHSRVATISAQRTHTTLRANRFVRDTYRVGLDFRGGRPQAYIQYEALEVVDDWLSIDARNLRRLLADLTALCVLRHPPVDTELGDFTIVPHSKGALLLYTPDSTALAWDDPEWDGAEWSARTQTFPSQYPDAVSRYLHRLSDTAPTGLYINEHSVDVSRLSRRHFLTWKESSEHRTCYLWPNIAQRLLANNESAAVGAFTDEVISINGRDFPRAIQSVFGAGLEILTAWGGATQTQITRQVAACPDTYRITWEPA